MIEKQNVLHEAADIVLDGHCLGRRIEKLQPGNMMVSLRLDAGMRKAVANIFRILGPQIRPLEWSASRLLRHPFIIEECKKNRRGDTPARFGMRHLQDITAAEIVDRLRGTHNIRRYYERTSMILETAWEDFQVVRRILEYPMGRGIDVD